MHTDKKIHPPYTQNSEMNDGEWVASLKARCYEL